MGSLSYVHIYHSLVLFTDYPVSSFIIYWIWFAMPRFILAKRKELAYLQEAHFNLFACGYLQESFVLPEWMKSFTVLHYLFDVLLMQN